MTITNLTIANWPYEFITGRRTFLNVSQPAVTLGGTMRERTGPKPPGGKVKRYRAASNGDRLDNLAAEVNRACSLWLLRKGITPDLPSAWAKKINYSGEDSE
jgi:hypothetical protein